MSWRIAWWENPHIQIVSDSKPFLIVISLPFFFWKFKLLGIYCVIAELNREIKSIDLLIDATNMY